MNGLDITNWTALLVALSALVINAIKRDTMSDNEITLITVATVCVLFFAGRALDGVLVWPLPPAMAAQLAAALVANQAIYLLTRNTTPMRQAEQLGNPPSDA